MTRHVWPVYGHDWAVDHLRKALANDRVRHAYLIVGSESAGKETLARAFAMTLNCTEPDEAARPCRVCRSCKLIASGNHPDMLFSELDPGTGTLKIEEIRSVTQRIALKPYEARYRIALFRDFDHARPQAQDALLKTLEEPPPQALLLLLAPSTESLLSTITSRSQILHLRAVSVDTIRETLIERCDAQPEQADLLARLSGGRMGWAIRTLQDSAILEQRTAALDLLEEVLAASRAKRFEIADSLSKDKLSVYPLLELWQTYWRDVLLVGQGNGETPANIDRQETIEHLTQRLVPDEALAALKATRLMLAKLSMNLNLRLALEVMLLDYPGLERER